MAFLRKKQPDGDGAAVDAATVDAATTLPDPPVRDPLEFLGAIIGIVAAGAGILASWFAVGYLYAKGKEASSTLAFLIYLCASNFLFILALIVLAPAYRSAARRNAHNRHARTDLEKSAAETLIRDERMSLLRKLTADVHAEYCADLRRAIVSASATSLEKAFDAYLVATLNHTAELFSACTGDNSAACVKLLLTEGATKSVGSALPPGAKAMDLYTLRRDQTSGRMRRAIDERYAHYSYTRNAAFSLILDRPHEPDYFICDDLKKAEAEGWYWNENEKWDENYNATAVVPIMYTARDKDEEDRCVGFLCIDNHRGGFNNKRCVYILNGIAADLYYSIRTTGDLLRQANGIKTDA